MELDLREQARSPAAGEALLEAFTEHSPAVMFVKDREGRYRFVNPQFLQRFGLRREQVIGRTDTELFPQVQAGGVLEERCAGVAEGGGKG